MPSSRKTSSNSGCQGFVRDEYEEEKFSDVADQVRQTQMKAEKIVVWNMPIMQFVMYGCMIAVSWFGGNLIIAGDMLRGTDGVHKLHPQILMSLMMITVVFVMFVITQLSCKNYRSAQ